jgi:hypothetical protein
MVDFGLILKCAALLIALFGVICGIVIWFVPQFSLEGLTTGLVVILLNGLIFLAELRPAVLIETSVPFLRTAFGRSVHLVIIGLLFAGTDGLAIACWVIFWVFAGVYLLIGFVGDRFPGIMNSGFRQMPANGGGQTQNVQASDQPLTDSYNQVEQTMRLAPFVPFQKAGTTVGPSMSASDFAIQI